MEICIILFSGSFVDNCVGLYSVILSKLLLLLYVFTVAGVILRSVSSNSFVNIRVALFSFIL